MTACSAYCLSPSWETQKQTELLRDLSSNSDSNSLDPWSQTRSHHMIMLCLPSCLLNTPPCSHSPLWQRYIFYPKRNFNYFSGTKNGDKFNSYTFQGDISGQGNDPKMATEDLNFPPFTAIKKEKLIKFFAYKQYLTKSKRIITLTAQVLDSRKMGALCNADTTAIKEWRLFKSRSFYKDRKYHTRSYQYQYTHFFLPFVNIVSIFRTNKTLNCEDGFCLGPPWLLQLW